MIILAGGLGTRLSEFTESMPKPMVPIGGKPILWHIMEIYAYYGHKEFFLALGYKAQVVKAYFANYRQLNSDFTVDLQSGRVTPIEQNLACDWSVSLIDTGELTMTGGRIKRLQKFVGNETFFVTYGDGLSTINIDQLLNFHRSHGKLATVSAVRPGARFGELEIIDSSVVSFHEKPQLARGWINGGFFIFEPDFFDLIEGDETMLERQPLERAASAGQLMAYQHDGFWHCVDTRRDLESLQRIWDKGAPWIR